MWLHSIEPKNTLENPDCFLHLCTKSLQGLHYISSAGSQAFDDLADVVNRLGDEFMGMTWAREQKERLKSAKRYLKVDFKVKLKVLYNMHVYRS